MPHFIFEGLHKKPDIKLSTGILHRKKNIPGEKLTIKLVELNMHDGPEAMLAALSEGIAECKRLEATYSLAIEGNYGKTGKNAWIVDRIIALMDLHKYYPTYFIMGGNGDTDPAPRVAAIELGKAHAQKHNYKFKPEIRELKLTSPEQSVRGLDTTEAKKNHANKFDITPEPITETAKIQRSASAGGNARGPLPSPTSSRGTRRGSLFGSASSIPENDEAKPTTVAPILESPRNRNGKN